MKIQNSRNSRQPNKDYSSVCHQQGRMLTDADLTEQALIARDRLNEALKDVIGSGTPRHGALLQVIEAGGEQIPSLHWGRVYVDGIPAAVRAADDAPDADQFDYAHQLRYPEAPALPAGSAHRLYVDVWERSVIWLQDEGLRDPGLHGADTTARTQTLAQVKWCAADQDPLCSDINPTLGDARLRLVLRSLATGTDPCDPCAEELELNDPVGNYLFRVEVHDVAYDANDQPEAVVLKWSSENGAEAYATSSVPPDFASNQFVYEFFDETTEQRLGIHLARDGSNQRVIDGQRPGLLSVFSASAPQAKDSVRRWDGWCRIEKSGSDWQLSAGFEGTIDLTSGVGADKPGHVTQGGDGVSIELRVITLSLELADHPLVAGDYWSAPVRESVHQQGEVLLADPDSGAGVAPQGEPHHYMLLVDVDAEGKQTVAPASGCDGYNACRLPQFPSLTDLRASDICFDNNVCDMPEVVTVQDALDQLCQERDLRWHNRHLHGWGVVCGLILECDPEQPDAVILNGGYALDCEGNDMVVDEEGFTINIPERLEEEGIDPAGLAEDQGVCLYLEFTEDKELDVGIELYEEEQLDWWERLRGTLLHDFYDDCILDLVKALTGELQDTEVEQRCALTVCGREQIRPAKRRTLTLANLLFHYQQGEAETILNLSQCEHALLRDLYDSLKNILRSRTFCAQFEQQAFPDYPFADEPICRATWFTPETLDHVRPSADGKLVFGWQRNSARVFVFQQLEKGCLGDLVGYFDVPQMDQGTLTDLNFSDGVLTLVGIVHQEDSLFARGKLGSFDTKNCEIKIDWQTSFMCGIRIVRLVEAPWSNKQLYLVGLCKGVYLFERDALFSETKIERDPDWGFAASGHIDFDLRSGLVFATAAGSGASCLEGYYNQLVMFNGLPVDGVAQPVTTLIPRAIETQQIVLGSDGFVLGRVGDSRSETPTPAADVAGVGLLEQIRGLTLFLVGELGEQKILYRFDSNHIKAGEAKTVDWFGDFHHGFEAADRVALQYLKAEKHDGVIATRYAMHDMQYIPGDPSLYKDGLLDSIPVQAGPVAVAVIDSRQQILVLNHMGQSFTLLNDGLEAYQKGRDTLGQYRVDVLAAFYGLLSGLLQYLKDCFCNHLLIHCAECTGDEKVYLGCLTLRDGAVYNICNFTKRKFVKTAESIAYWLSIIPIGPLVGWLVEELCCLILPNYFQQRETPTFSITPNQLGVAKAVMHTDRNNILSGITSGSQEIARKGLTQVVGAGYKDQRDYPELVGKEYRYKPGVFQPPQVALASDAQVRKQVQTLAKDRSKSTQQVNLLQQQVLSLQADRQSLVERVGAVEADKQKAEQEVANLKAQLVGLQQEKSTTDARILELEKTQVEFNDLRTSMQPLINAAKPVSSVEGVTPETATLLEKNRITTVKALADADPTLLRELGMTDDTATNLVKLANDQLLIK
jgi:hypothetical protein